MKPKVVQLHVHKNTLAKRKRKALREEALAELKEMLTECNAKAYALVVIDEDEVSTTSSNMGSLSPSQFALLLRKSLSEEITGAVVEHGEEVSGEE